MGFLLCILNKLMCIEYVAKCVAQSKSLSSSNTELFYNEYVIIIVSSAAATPPATLILPLQRLNSQRDTELPPLHGRPLHIQPLASNMTISSADLG